MINLNESDIKKLKYINQGTFGMLYQKDDNTAYKIYKDEIKTKYNSYIKNPCLRIPKSHYDLIKEKSKNIKGTEFFKDLIYIDGRFKGVVIPFYQGETLSKYSNIPMNKRIELVTLLINKSKELTKNNIIYTDYKINNIIVQDNDIKLIDLDDLKTHPVIVKDPVLYSYSIYKLNETVQDLFGQEQHLNLNEDVWKRINRQRGFYTIRKSKLDKYIKNKQTPRDILFIDKDTYPDGGKFIFKLSHYGKPNELVHVSNRKLTKEINEAIKSQKTVKEFLEDLSQEYKNYKPIKININNEKDELLLNVNELSFALHEMNLLLDNYPNNDEALGLFNRFREMEKKAIQNYERRFGPLEITSSEINNIPFSWEDYKWPWEI